MLASLHHCGVSNIITDNEPPAEKSRCRHFHCKSLLLSLYPQWLRVSFISIESFISFSGLPFFFAFSALFALHRCRPLVFFPRSNRFVGISFPFSFIFTNSLPSVAVPFHPLISPIEGMGKNK